MKNKLKNFLKDILLESGYKITKNNTTPLLHDNPFVAASSEIKMVKPIIFDVGVNHGQTLKKIKDIFPKAIIHGFEPSRKCFQQLKQDFRSECIILNNTAVGDKEEFLNFNEYSWDALNSLLERAYSKSSIVENYKVPVTTLDIYCKNNGVEKINFLKTDTEGFELKVLSGASEMMSKNRIQFVHVEIFFNLNFIGQSSAGDIFNFLEANQFSLVRFYGFSYDSEGKASKADALFYNPRFQESRITA